MKIFAPAEKDGSATITPLFASSVAMFCYAFHVSCEAMLQYQPTSQGNSPKNDLQNLGTDGMNTSVMRQWHASYGP